MTLEQRGTAGQVFQSALAKINQPDQTPFFLENPRYLELSGGARAIVDFLAVRPALLVLDALDVNRVIRYADDEWYEAEAETDRPERLVDEAADMAFFSVLAGMLFWEEMGEGQKEFVCRAIEWARGKAELHDFDLNTAIINVAKIKDPPNYPEELYQIDSDEDAHLIPERVDNVRRLGRQLRRDLNGQLKEGNLILNLNIARAEAGTGSYMAEVVEALALYARLEVWELEPV